MLSCWTLHPRLRSLASPAMGYCGDTCPIDFQQQYFSSLRCSTKSITANFVWLLILYSFENVWNRQREAFEHTYIESTTRNTSGYEILERDILLPLLRLTPRRRGFPGMIFVNFCIEVKGWLRYKTAKKSCRKFQPPEHGARTLQTTNDRRICDSSGKIVFTRTWLRYVRVFAVAIPSVCLSFVVCNVGAPYSRVWSFRSNFFTAVYAGHPLTSMQNFTEIVLGEPLRRER